MMISKSTLKMCFKLSFILLGLLALSPVKNHAIKISEIQGNHWQSKLRGQQVQEVHGIVTAIDNGKGFYIQDPHPDDDSSSSEAIYVLYKNAFSFQIGDSIVIRSAKVAEFAPYQATDANSITELIEVQGIDKSSKFQGETITPTEINIPPLPTELIYDNDFLTINTAQSNIQQENSKLNLKRGLDYFESLEGMLVKISKPIATSKMSKFGTFWVLPNRGIHATGVNAHQGITIRPIDDDDHVSGGTDANPEKIQIAPPLDREKTPNNIVMGTELDDIVGVLDFAFGNWRVRPLRRVVIENLPQHTQDKISFEVMSKSSSKGNLETSSFKSILHSHGVYSASHSMRRKTRNPDFMDVDYQDDESKDAAAEDMEIDEPFTHPIFKRRVVPSPRFSKTTYMNTNPLSKKESIDQCIPLLIATYNIENFHPNSRSMKAVAKHITENMQSPAIVGLQEVQDNDGSKQSNVVSCDLTMNTLIKHIQSLNGPLYDFVVIDPLNNQDGGQPGGNIRNVFLYRKDIVALSSSTLRKSGMHSDAQKPILTSGGLKFNYNPGRIDPLNPVWARSRKPLSVQFDILEKGTTKKTTKKIILINNHMKSKIGSSSIFGAIQPPKNGGLKDRVDQSKNVREYVRSIQEIDPSSHIVVLGDFNEFYLSPPLLELKRNNTLIGLMETLLSPEERYTYVFDGNSQALDHIYVSPSLLRNAQVQPLHLNTWKTKSEEASDHDPVVAQIQVC